MLKYVIMFCIISLRQSDASLSGNYSQLKLVQHSPITSYFASLPNVNISAQDFVEYFRDHSLMFNAQRWIIHGLWALDSNGKLLTECKKSNDRKVKYIHESLENDFEEDLAIMWPVLSENIMQEELWEKEYNMYGSCVSTSTSTYFTGAYRLTAFRNIGGILGRSKILPGNTYDLDRIITVITNLLKKQVYLKCISDQNNEKQYLLGVELCFNRMFRLADCYTSSSHECDPNKSVIYPEKPGNAQKEEE